MNVWRLAGISIFLLGTVCLIGTNKFSTPAAFGNGKDDKKIEITADPAKAEVKPGDSKTVDLKLKRGKDATKEVTLTAEVDPKEKGVTAKVDAKVAGDKSDAKLTVESKDTADGDYKVTVKGKSDGSPDATATFTLTVKKGEVAKKEPPTPGKGDIVFEAFNKKGTKFYQEQKTKTKQEMKVMGQVVIQEQTQDFLIEWAPAEKDKDGNYVVTQTIKGVKMNINIGGNKISYDSTGAKQKNPMTDFFEQLTKQELKFTIKPDLSSVVSIDGRKKFVDELGAINPQMQSLLNTILSDKALQKMAEPTWYAFPAGGKLPAVGGNWTRKSDLDLGPIGKYDTEFKFIYNGPKGATETFGVETKLTYTAPDAGSKAGLPFTIHDAKLTADKGTGTAIFDREKGRFSSTDIKMNLSGTLTIEVGSMKTTVELSQTQEASSTTYDEMPAAWKTK